MALPSQCSVRMTLGPAPEVLKASLWGRMRPQDAGFIARVANSSTHMLPAERSVELWPHDGTASRSHIEKLSPRSHVMSNAHANGSREPPHGPLSASRAHLPASVPTATSHSAAGALQLTGADHQQHHPQSKHALQWHPARLQAALQLPSVANGCTRSSMHARSTHERQPPTSTALSQPISS